jgi:hypothetical protein
MLFSIWSFGLHANLRNTITFRHDGLEMVPIDESIDMPHCSRTATRILCHFHICDVWNISLYIHMVII